MGRYQVRDHDGDSLLDSDVWWVASAYARRWGGAYVFDSEDDSLQWVPGDRWSVGEDDE
jgi:hypothetical protein